MFAKLTALALGGFTLPYNLEEPYPCAWGPWTHYSGKSKEDGSPVSVFKATFTDPNDRALVCARNGIKRLKMLRHPNVLAFRDSAETTERNATVLYLVTEPCKPVKILLQELDLAGEHRDQYISMGLLHMARAISFLNNDCNLIHGHVCLAAVVVTETLDWKLHGFDLVSEASMPPENALSLGIHMVGNQYKPAEVGRSEWQTVAAGPPWAVDSWGLGCLMQEAFSVEDMTSVENLRRTDFIPQALLSDYQKLLASQPARRLNPAKVATSAFLNNRLVEVVAFMESISVKDATDKESFFRRLPQSVPSIPPAVANRKILPLLTSALEYGGAPPIAVTTLLMIGKELGTDDFNKRVVPCLSKLFASPDRALRRSLLESMDQYVVHLTQNVIEEQIYPHLQGGFGDSHAFIRELTLKSILPLAPKMSNKTLVQGVLKHLSKLQVDEEPSIRANTTVLLGNLAQYLGEATCKRVLLNAFSRALKDMFPPARIAGLRALIATRQYYNAEDAAVRILPVVAPLAIDVVAEVRQASLSCLQMFTKELVDEDERRMKEAAAAGPGPEAGAIGGVVPGGVAGPGAGAGAAASSSSSSMLGWAMSSIMSSAANAAVAAVGIKNPPPSPGGGPGPEPRGSNSGAASQPAVAGSTSRAAGAAARTSSGGGGVSSKTSAAADGWDNDNMGLGSSGNGNDGWDDEPEVDEAEAKARARLMARPTTSSRPATTSTIRPAPGVTTTSAAARRPAEPELDWKPSSSAGGWELDDDTADGGGWEGMDMAAPVPSPQPKPVATSSAGGVRPAVRRPVKADGTSGSTGGATKKLGAMKLGATKLSAD